jgi:hypothetical protein
MSTTITASHRTIRIELVEDPSMSTLSVFSARGYERGSTFFTRDLAERVADLRKMYAYIKGEQSHYVRALDSLMVLAGVKRY